MKKTIFISCFAMIGISSLHAQWVNGYTKKDGTYVQGHMKSNPDSYRYNNVRSQSFGGSQRDEFSSGMGATNKTNSSYGYRDNDNDGTNNAFDPSPDSKNR